MPQSFIRPQAIIARLNNRLTGHLLLFAIFLLLFVPLFRPVVSLLDPVGYYAWARTIIIDGDLNVGNEYAHYGINAPNTPTGLTHNQWSAGSALLWLPAMFATHLFVEASNTVSADGYSWPYPFAASLTSALAGFLATLFTYRASLRFFQPLAALLATLGAWLATPLVFYQYHQPLMAHANDAFISAAILLTWLIARNRQFPAHLQVLHGALIGLSIWIRPQNGLFVVIFGLDIVFDTLRSGWRTQLPRTVWLASGCALLTVPLLLFWRIVFGSWLLNTYDATEGGSFNWLATHAVDVLFSSDRGLFVWTPIAVLSLLGIYALYQRNQRLAVLFSLFALGQFYVISSWSVWAGGDAFGPRFWLVLMPFCGLTLAALLDRIIQNQPRTALPLLGLISCFILWNFLLMLQYSLGVVAPTGEVDLALMVRNQFTLVPQLILDAIR